MKKTVITLLVLVAVWLAWSAWPFFALYDIARAAQAGDAARIERRVDIPALQRSLTDQIIAAYERVTGKRVKSGLIGAVAGAAVDPFIAKLATPGALAALLRDGWPKGVLAETPADFTPPKLTALGNVLSLYAASDYGLGEFRIALPLDTPAERRFRLQLALSNWTWRLTALDLPPELTERLARELARERG
ncbi:MAG: hypothetical protein QOG38_1252 [Hyphomicrobiales bacterium]|jgi:hypothetical protein|nr:hypothetical protein [Hyphomicrobiales bacterium]